MIGVLQLLLHRVNIRRRQRAEDRRWAAADSRHRQTCGDCRGP